MKGQLEYKDVLEAKGILEIYNGFKEHTRQTRFMMGYADYSEINYDGKESEIMKSPGMNFTGQGKIQWERVFILMLTAKSYVDCRYHPRWRNMQGI